MASTSVHIPDQLLKEIDKRAQKKGLSRNRFIIQACEQALDQEEGEWPDDFFDSDLRSDDLQLLREAGEEMEQAILEKRKNRSRISL